ncbi:MAG: inositol monophosphatase family protein [Bacillota bacterium]|nr:inositol monophosphatase family protein [Bacillota bacterium]
MTKNIDYQSLVDPVGGIVRRAGKLILDLQNETLQIEQKSDANYVTQIDFAVQTYVLDKLKELTPTFAVIAEESDVNQYSLEQPTWILDPVDGTTNLMRHYHHSAVSLALAVRGILTLGFVYNPYTEELFEAVANQGARLNGQKIIVSTRSLLSDSLIGFGTTPYAREQAHSTFLLLEQVFLRSLEIRRSGSAALDLAYVACGRLDGFFELCLQPWDYAAGGLILQEAGGHITNWQGTAPSLRHGDSILATNGHIHAGLHNLIERIVPSDGNNQVGV